jgi:hypothetical protein
MPLHLGLFPRALALGLDMNAEELVGLPFFVAAGLFLMAGGCVQLSDLKRQPVVVGELLNYTYQLN